MKPEELLMVSQSDYQPWHRSRTISHGIEAGLSPMVSQPDYQPWYRSRTINHGIAAGLTTMISQLNYSGYPDFERGQVKRISTAERANWPGPKKKEIIREAFPCFSNPSLELGSARLSIVWRPRLLRRAALSCRARRGLQPCIQDSEWCRIPPQRP